MKLLKNMYYLVLALAVVFTLNNCSQEEISPQDVELDKGTKELLAKKKSSYAGGQAGLVFEQGEGGLNGYQSFSFHVTKDIEGNISGSFQSNFNDSMDDGFDFNIHGVIECVTFVGNRATMAGTITRINAGEFWDDIDLETPMYDKVYFEVQDNGEGKKADPDQFSDVYLFLNQLFCDDFSVPLFDISNGNIQVTNNEMTDRHHGNNANPVIERVSAGGNDACEAFGLEPGCDGNFSLIAIKKADGTVMGQWQDTFAGGGVGIHAAIDCMYVVDNMAIVSGYVTHGSFDGVNDATGTYIITKVVDNGTSNNDPADQISFSFDITDEFGCELYSGFPLFDLTRGQVKVWSRE